MSRSYKRTPIAKSGGISSRRTNKRQANKRVRHARHIPNGKQYRKFYNPWEIYDSVNYYSKRRREREWEQEKIEFLNGMSSCWMIKRYGGSKERFMRAWYQTWYRK